MSAVESKPAGAPGHGATFDAPGGLSAPSASSPEPLVESASDAHETLMTYDATSRVPRYVIVVWAIVLLGLGTYFVRFYLPDLARWGRAI